ncbi:hypothetical protein TYRP_010419 [Tyrophagus putrescentiae]|nr:hypothetical protein TYRP_010419 [Tyrophagus putrescentiae]
MPPPLDEVDCSSSPSSPPPRPPVNGRLDEGVSQAVGSRRRLKGEAPTFNADPVIVAEGVLGVHLEHLLIDEYGGVCNKKQKESSYKPARYIPEKLTQRRPYDELVAVVVAFLLLRAETKHLQVPLLHLGRVNANVVSEAAAEVCFLPFRNTQNNKFNKCSVATGNLSCVGKTANK